MAGLASLYSRLPQLLQHGVCSLEGWRIQKDRFGEPFPALLTEAEKRTFVPVDRVRAYRNQRLHAFVRHCARTIPYYQRRFKELGISPDDVRTLEDLKGLPILTKEEVQEHCPELVSEAIPKREQIITHTSGTTGAGLHFTTTRRAIQEQWATWWRYHRWHGIQPGTWCAHFGGKSVVPVSQTKPPFWRYNYPGRQILFSAYHMSSTSLGYYLGELRRKRPPWLHGYPSLLALLASYILESAADLGYKVRWITVGAENLLPQQAELIERAFGVRPRQHYGLAEGAANISECEYGKLHVDEDFSAVEFVPDPNGLGYKVIGTNFTNLAMPFLRYDTEDLVTLSNETCPCGRPGRLVASIDGRQEDYVVLKNGARLGRMDHIFKNMVNIREAQIYQNTPGKIVIYVVRGDRYLKDDEATLLQETRKRVGEETVIAIKYVAKLRRSPTEKLRFVVSELPEGKLNGVLQ